MIKDLMGKLHITDSINDNNPQKQAEGPTMPEQQQQAQPSAPKPPVPPAPKAEQVSFSQEPEIKVQKEGKPMEDDGIIIDLGEGISLNVPIKKRMALHEFLRVAEKVKALEMLAEEGQYARKY